MEPPKWSMAWEITCIPMPRPAMSVTSDTDEKSVLNMVFKKSSSDILFMSSSVLSFFSFRYLIMAGLLIPQPSSLILIIRVSPLLAASNLIIPFAFFPRKLKLISELWIGLEPDLSNIYIY